MLDNIENNQNQENQDLNPAQDTQDIGDFVNLESTIISDTQMPQFSFPNVINSQIQRDHVFETSFEVSNIRTNQNTSDRSNEAFMSSGRQRISPKNVLRDSR